MDEMNSNTLCGMCDRLVNFACEHMEDLEQVDTHEMGEVIDMIKDLAEAYYYKAKAEAIHNEPVADHVEELIPEIANVYNNADAESKKNIKTHLTKMVADMN